MKSTIRFSYYLLAILVCGTSPGLAQPTSWHQTNGPYGGNVQALFVHPNGDLLAGTREGGLYRSSDNGETWDHIGLNGEFIWSFAVQPDGNLLIGIGGGIFRGSRDGTGWQQILSIDTAVRALALGTNGNIIAGSTQNDYPSESGQIFRSTDNGETWAQSNTGLRATGVRALLTDRDATIYAGTWSETSAGGGVFRSTDNGESWHSLGLAGLAVQALHIDESGTIAAATSEGVFFSSDSGVTWQPRNEGLPEGAVIALVAAADGRLLASNVHGVFRLSGSQWTPFGAGLTESHAQTLAGTPRGDVFAGSTVNGLFRLDRGASIWAHKSTGINNTNVTSLLENRDGFLFAVAAQIGVFRSRDAGISWQKLPLDGTRIGSLALGPDGVIYANASGFGGIHRSTDNGETWERLGLETAIVNNLLFRSNTEIFATTFDGLYRSGDAGATWQPIAFAGRHTASLIANHQGVLFVRSAGALHRSVDNGATWMALPAVSRNATGLAVNSVDHLFAATAYDGGVYRSMDNGESWEHTGLLAATETASDRLYVGPLHVTAGDELYAGTNRGLYRSLDNGESWVDISDNAIPNLISALLIDAAGHFFVATRASGIFRSGEPLPPQPVFDFQLEQNYPNPFNASTTFRFTLPQSGFVLLKIYDVRGREVATPVAEGRVAGANQVTWNAGDLPSGVYFARLQAGGLVETRKVMLLR